MVDAERTIPEVNRDGNDYQGVGVGKNRNQEEDQEDLKEDRKDTEVRRCMLDTVGGSADAGADAGAVDADADPMAVAGLDLT
jgi:hypothetical protein